MLACFVLVPTVAWAELPRVVDTGPVDRGTVSSFGEDFFVRCNQPVDHMQSRLIIKRGDDVVETLRPRLKTEPNVLFARSAGLAAGDYKPVWVVKALEGQLVDVGEITVKVKDGK
jgi:hypothetical protein